MTTGNLSIIDDISQDELNHWEESDAVSDADEKTNDQKKLSTLRVIRSNHDYNLDYLVGSIDKNINLGPDYQRRSRWSKVQQSKLIESFLMNIPVPPIFLYENEVYEYEVIDGRQRLEAIKAFFNNEFRLKGLDYLTQFNKSKFSDLDNETQRSLFRRTITATILLVESQNFDKYDLRMILFNRLNTGGIKLNGQELRNAIYASNFNDLVLELSQNQNFKDLWAIPSDANQTNHQLYKTMMDCELVLRFFAIHKVYDGSIEGSMKKILDETMKLYLKTESGTLDTLRALFTDSVNLFNEKYGAALITNTNLSPAKKARNLYDSMLVAISLVPHSELVDKCVALRNLEIVLGYEEDYDRIISKGNSVENIKYRVQKSITILTTEM